MFLDLKFILVFKYPGNMNFRAKSFFERLSFAFLYDLFTHVWI